MLIQNLGPNGLPDRPSALLGQAKPVLPSAGTEPVHGL